MSLLWVDTLRAESWALIRVLRSARLRHDRARVFDMVAESTVSSRHQRSPCCDIPTIGQLHMWRYTARAQARKFTARPRWAVASTMGGADRSAPRRIGAICARAAYKT